MRNELSKDEQQAIADLEATTQEILDLKSGDEITFEVVTGQGWTGWHFHKGDAQGFPQVSETIDKVTRAMVEQVVDAAIEAFDNLGVVLR